MALFEAAYTPPGVYTTVIQDATSANLSSNARIPVFIGEGVQYFTESNVMLHRGSSASSDDQVVNENLSAQVTGTNNTFQLSFYPVVTGDGTGTTTNNPTYVQIIAGGVPATVVSLNGATGLVTLADLIPVGTVVTASYYFKRKDTLITNEDESFQIPSFATLAAAPFASTDVVFSVTIPGELGNLVSLAFTLAPSGSGVADAAAVTGIGTDAISIELRDTDNTVRTLQDIVLLVNAGIQTLDAGYLTVQGALTGSQLTTAGTAAAAVSFTGGSGPNTNTVFKTKNVPIVDGTNGGVVTTNPALVTATVNGTPVTVAAVNGANGLVTLAQGVAAGSHLKLTYYTNTWQNTGDSLPGGNIGSITQVGLGPNRSDFIAGVDYLLSGNNIAWGASLETQALQSTAGYTPFDATAIDTTLVDQAVYLQPVNGTVNGKNTVFTLNDSPVDGSGLSKVTDNPSLVSIYVGTNPVTALASGPVGVLRLSGASATVTTINPPATGNNVYASYYRSVLNDHTFTLTVSTAGNPATEVDPAAGGYTIVNELNEIAPSILPTTSNVAASNFRTTGLVWPHNFPDLTTAVGAADEVITLTFQNDSLTKVVTPATQASITIHDTSSVARITLRVTNPGVAGNAVSIALVGGPTGASDASAISVTGNAITVATLMADNSTVRTWQDIVDLFSTYPATTTAGGLILCSGVTGADLTSQASASAAANFSGGAAAVTTPYANRYLVTSSRTSAAAAADGLGITGGATTGGSGTGASGYLGQTYIDPATGVTFTVLDPSSALSYGYTSLPSPTYVYAAGDTLTFTISRETPIAVSTTPTIAIPGLRTEVSTTLGMNPGDKATVQTFNKSGDQPNVGEYYYVTYTINKQTSDYALQTFDNVSDAYAVYGQPTTTSNRLALAISLFAQNGGQQFACVQVPVQQGSIYASDDSFIAAIQSLTIPFPGSDQMPDVILPLSTSANVQQTLSRFLITQATPLQQAEAISFIGFSKYTTPTQIASTVQGIANERVIANSIVAAGISLQGPTDLTATTYAVSGEMVAAALCGLYCSPSIDVATTLTGLTVVGFTRNLIPIDVPTQNALAAAGVTVLTDVPGALYVRHYKTTNPANALTSEPYCTTISDYISQQVRANLNQFKGRKMTSDLPSSITAVGNALLTGWNNVLITAYTPFVVVQDAVDPTTYDISFSIRPMFSLLYMQVTLTVNLSS